MNPSEEPRKRTARACDSCYKRKIKCDAAEPQCNWCSHHNLPCTFDRVVQRKRKPDEEESSRPKASRLAERISRIEQLLAENLMRDPTSEGAMEVPPLSDLATNASNSPTSSNTSISQPIISSTVGVHFAGRELGVMSLMTGIPFLLPEGQQWIQARTGQTISSDKLSPARAPWEKERGQISNSILMDLRSQDLFSLPDQRSVMLYFNAYRNSPVMRRVFPLVDADLFAETIQEVYQQPQSSFQFGQASSRACVIAFLAFVARLPPVKNKTLDSPFSYVDHESLAVKSQFLLSQVMQEPASLEGAQAVSLMTLYEISSGNMRACNYFGALAARLVFMLGGNLLHSRTYLPSDRGKKKRQQLRNLFWVCYTMDKDIALRTGQPPTIADENCDLTLPAGYLEAAYDTPEDERISFSQPVFPFDLRLSIIKSRTHSALYSISALQKSDADLLKSIRELDDELEAWRLSVPSPYRPTMSFTPEAVDPNVSMHSVMLRLNYYLCMSLIHSASSRCKAWGQGNHGMMDGVNSSLALSVEASRSTLCYLEAAEHVLVDGVFWTLVFYPMSALLAIFCSILSNPLDPRSRDDLDRLRLATQMIQRIFERKLPENEMEQLKMVGEFVSELKRLAECSIDKAWSEQSATLMSR
ncbi:transcriptional regulator family: Fungal Specific TF [Penicillium chermesinum]|uniref:Transcriptional regulator family: Fungal Specific TF n=1 Tax=Penicillium chermesinum TaxID=63820 RepID=A0A9W9NQ22_9EURO|nr:transcriptional regulator family: Fungal Specific TF [Penicillium chermesinum]KAJ5223886.1 transcriptional regulator family: Fungal Specific TF [Penicillium chermesinum]